MFSKSRKKIILSIMGSIIILFAVTLSVILLASFREIRQKNLDMLERYVEDYSIDNKEKNRNNKDLELEKILIKIQIINCQLFIRLQFQTMVQYLL